MVMAPQLSYQQISETEFTIGENRISLLDNSTIYIEAIGEQTDEHAREISKLYKKIYSDVQGKLKQLVNLNHSGKSSPKARQVYEEMNNHERTYKVAVFGIHPVARVLAAFVTGLTRKKNIEFFSNKEDALEWLNK
jgi:hypothetical protein